MYIVWSATHRTTKRAPLSIEKDHMDLRKIEAAGSGEPIARSRGDGVADR